MVGAVYGANKALSEEETVAAAKVLYMFHMFFLGLCMMLENSQRFFDKFEKSEDGSINQEEFMKALAEERNLVDILTQNGRCYQGMDL